MAAERRSDRKQARFEEIAQLLGRLGVKADSYIWRPRQCELTVAVAGKLRTLKISASMTRIEFAMQMGRVAGWIEALA